VGKRRKRDVMSTDDQCEETGKITSGDALKQNTMTSK
jgi:hypothetical protein